MVQGGTRKVVVSPVGIEINGTRYEERLIIGGCLFGENPPILHSIRCKGCKGELNPGLGGELEG